MGMLRTISIMIPYHVYEELDRLYEENRDRYRNKNQFYAEILTLGLRLYRPGKQEKESEPRVHPLLALAISRYPGALEEILKMEKERERREG